MKDYKFSVIEYIYEIKKVRKGKVIKLLEDIKYKNIKLLKINYKK